jgi:2'-5' RNA ligase
MEDRMNQAIHRYLFAVMLDGETERHIQDLREKYGIPAWEPKIGLHVTLLRPFYGTVSIADLARSANCIARQYSRFTLNLTGLGRFDNPKGSVLYAQVTPDAVLSELHQDLKQNLEYLTGQMDFPLFTPHVSISPSTTADQVDAYMAQLAGETIALRMPCTSFSLLRMDHEWRIVHNFNLR